MADKLPPLENCLAVRLKDCILVLSKHSHFSIFSDKSAIWMYNLWTETWMKYDIIPKPKPEVNGHTGVVIGTDVYICGERGYKSMLSKLTRNPKGKYAWSIIHIEDQSKVPSPRFDCCAWEYGEKMWVWGADGPSTDDQLLYFDPSTKTWINVKCSGEVPSPGNRASTTKMQDNVWLHETTTINYSCSLGLYTLSMHSFTWTRIETTMPKPIRNSKASLTPISASQLLSYGGFSQDISDKNLTLSWIFDIQSRQWKQHPIAETYHRWNHTGITGLNSRVIILGGGNTISVVILEPKSLEQLAIQRIYKHRSKLPWKKLPKKLTCKIMFPE